jgi:gliding motility-associated-like protein
MDGMNRYWNRLTCSLLLLFVLGFAPLLSMAQPVINGEAPYAGQSVFRSGDRVRLIGTGLAAFPCATDSLILRWTVPSPSFIRLIRGGAPTQTTFTTSSNGVTDTITFLMPASIPCGSITATMRKFTAAACTSPQTSAAYPVLALVGNKALVTYPNNGIFCLNDAVTMPTKSEAGIFTSMTIPPAFLNSANGSLLLNSSIISTHSIKFVAAYDTNVTSPGCKDSVFVSITVKPNGPGQSMSYPVGPFCGAKPTFKALDSVPAVVGIFTSSPPGLWVDSLSGSIRPDSSNTGTYLVTFTPEHDACTAAITESVEIDSIRQIDFRYLTGICAFESGLAPVITQFYPGRFDANPLFGAVGNLGCDPSTGVLDATLVSSGTFEVIFEPDSMVVDCPDTSRVVVTVVALPDPSFTIANDSACRNGANVPLNILVPGTTGSFYDRTLTVGFSGTTAIDVGSTTGGPLAITFVATTTSSGVTCVDSTSRPFTVIGPQTAAINYPVTAVCSGKPDTLSPVFISGTLGGRFLIRGTAAVPPVIDPVSGEIFISAATSPGSYTVTYQFAGFNICRDSINIGPITLSPEPVMDFYFGFPGQTSRTVCSNAGRVGVDSSSTGGITSASIDVYGSQAGVPYLHIIGDSLDPAVLGVGGPYTVVLSSQRGGCASYDTIYFKVDQFYSSAFNYLDSVACQGGSNPVPHILGYGGGIFDQVSMVTISLDTTNGEIDISALDNIDGDTIIVAYSTENLSATCFDVTLDTIIVIGVNSADFEYEKVRFCKSDNDTLVPMVPDTTIIVTGGNFSWTPITGGVLNMPSTQTGIIYAALSDTGTYTISNIIQGGGCVSQFSLSIRILPGFIPTTMDYADSTYCKGQPNPTPSRTGDLSGIFIGTPGINLINAAGQIDLANSIPDASRYYVIQYRLENDDGCILTLLDSVKILPLDGSFFLYNPSFICSTVDTVQLDSMPTTTNGTFSIRDFNNLVVPGAINPVNGEIYPGLLDSTGFQRQYTVFFTPTANSCTQPHQQPLTFLRGPEGAGIDVFPDSLFCDGTSVTVSALGILDGAWFVVNDQLPLGGAYQHLESFIRSNSWDSGDSITVTLFTGELDTVQFDTTDALGNPIRENLQYPGGGYVIDESKICFVRRTVTMEVKPLPTLTLVDSVQVLSSDQPAVFGLQSSMDATTVQWSVENDTLPGNGDFVPPGGLETFNTANTTYPIRNVINLIKDYSPAQAEYVFTPTANGCIGESLVYHLNVNPGGTDVFVPQVFTPDGDEFNETWYVQVRTGVSADDYSLELFNRAGGLVYRMQPLISTWDGEGLPDGVYWWNLKDRQGNSVDKGGLTIRRK